MYLAVKISLYGLAILARAGHVVLFQGIEIYIIILAYGAGVDYCLFLTARVREEREHNRGLPPRDAVANALGSVGAALTASAATVMGGIAMMMFAEFGKFREAGFAIPLSLVTVLCATLTFTPSLLCLVGRWAFWPQRLGQAAPDSPPPKGVLGWVFGSGELHWLWEKVGETLLRRPGKVWLGTVALMTPAVIIAALFYQRVSYDLIGSLPAVSKSVTGTEILAKHFPAGVMGPVTVLLIDPQVDFCKPPGRAIVARLTDRLVEQKAELGLADVRGLTTPLGIVGSSKRPFEKEDIPREVIEEAVNRMARERYTTDMGERGRIGTRLDVVLAQSPFSHQSIVDLEGVKTTIEEALPEDTRGKADLYFVGPTASVSDLAVVMQRDRSRIESLVLASVFVILVLLLRRILVPIYLLLSVLFSYYATLGTAFAVFWLLDPRGFMGIDWKVAIFLFTILIAVGEDYNIFLMTRIHEEDRNHEPLTAVTEALTRTGPIISSCGIIMAGTFASLLAGSLTEMKQLGFALVFGVLLDTFVVRPILLPSALILLRRLRQTEERE
jgi:RND superfamily putative drug exporter